ncbi:hypothetical protein DRO66_05925 [Candidatus Bathyarchaeota archaeon]|nr:MAG: hypothetical protein DRO66_05925 [Candidatus Bathyarchaeota archaeon]
MNSLIMAVQIPMIKEIISNEKYLESERRGYDVGVNDKWVQHNVCLVVARVGAEMRKRAIEFIKQGGI